MTLHLVVVIRTKSGRGREQVAAFESLAPLVRAEVGCLRYDLHAVDGDEDRFVLLEEWATQGDLDAHGAGPHLAAAAAVAASFRAGPAEVMVIKPISTP